MSLTHQWSRDSGVIGEMVCAIIEIDKDNHKYIPLFELKIEYSTLISSTGALEFTAFSDPSTHPVFSVYSPQTSQIQAVEEGLSRTCVGVSPQGPLTLHRDEMTPPPLKEYSMGERLQSLGTSLSTQGRDDSSSTEGVLHQCTALYYNYTKTYLTEMAVAP